DAVRRARRRAELPLPDPAAGDALPAGDDPGATVDVLAVREALGRLSATDRAVLVLVDLEGFSMEEAATFLGTTNVGTRLRAVRARRKLGKLLRRGSLS